MLAVPFIAGVVFADQLRWFMLPLAVTWLAAYLCFNALTLWLKAATAKRSSYWPAMLTYLVLSVVAGVVTLVFAGLQVLGWLAVFAVPGFVALWLAAQRRERDIVSGAMTTAVASAMTLVVAYPDPLSVVRTWPASQLAVCTTLALFGYFFGTVVHVKSLIREHARAKAEVRNNLWHLLVFIWLTVAVFNGLLPAWWLAIGVIVLTRAIGMGVCDRTKRFTALQIGLTEVLISLLIAVSLLIHPAPQLAG